jgi:cephalosporin hydroxylase
MKYHNITGKVVRKAYSLAGRLLRRIISAPVEVRLRFQGYGHCFAIFSHMRCSEKILLYRLPRGLKEGSIILEIGSYLGASSTFLAAGAKECGSVVYCIDTWMNDAMSEGCRDTYDQFILNTRKFAGQIRPIRGGSLQVARQFSEKIDLLFLDGDHSYAGCHCDAEAWLPKLRPGGIIVFHDTWAEGVWRTIQEFVKPLEISSGHMIDTTYWTKIDNYNKLGNLHK